MNMTTSREDTKASGAFSAQKDNGFDPMSELLVAQSSKPLHLGEINLRALSPFHRALLVIDGTVTKFIEAYTLEPVEVVRLRQETRRLSTKHVWLEADKDTAVIARQVLLQGKYSSKLYAYAVSLIVLDRLGEEVKNRLEIDGDGLGRILLNSRMETRREVLWYGKEHAKGLPGVILNLVNGDCISRTYRIIADGQPIMLINEKFPSSGDQLPSHY
jgi:chorismate-pyruvate lyase